MERQRAVVVSALGITQTLAWGSTYYLPAIFAGPMADGLHIPRAWVFGVFSAALLFSGLLGPLAGRTIDRYGGRDVLAATNLAFAAGLLLLSQASGMAGLILAWAVLGAGMGFGLYEAAFATVAGLYKDHARGAITGITLFAGFASTVSWPTSDFLIHAIGWREGAMVWAALHLLLGLPVNRFLVPPSPPPARPGAQGGAQEAKMQEAGGALSGTMILLATVFGVTWFVSTAYSAHLPGLLVALGATPTAAVAAASLVGPAQVVARLIEFGVLRRAPPMLSARLAAALHPAAAVILIALGAPAALPFVLLHGGGNGMLTIARGTLPLALFGPAGYGLRTGILAMPAKLLQGAAPLAFGLMLENAGPRWALACSAILMALCCAALFLIRPKHAA